MARSWVLLRVAAAGVILVVTALTWRVLDQQRSAHLQTLIDREISFAGELLVRDLRARFAAISHFAHMWERGTPPDAAQFYADAQEQMDNAPGLWAISVADQDNMMRYVVPVDFAEMEGQSISVTEAHTRALTQARDTRRAVLSDPVELIYGSGTGFLMYVPLFEQDHFHGTLIAVFHVERWLESLYGSDRAGEILPDFDVFLTLNGTTLFDTRTPMAALSEHGASTDLLWESAALRLEATPRQSYYASHWHWTPESLAAIVMLTLSAVAALFNLLQRARRAEATAQAAAFDLLDLNRSLRTEAEVRRKAEDEAERARAATSRFLATMSHEIRTPLNAIMGMFQLIHAADAVPDRQRKQADMGIDAARRLHRDLSNVLDISRLDAGALRVRPAQTDLPDLVQQWATALEGFVIRADKPIKPQFEIDADLPSVATLDDAALTQVVNNLMDNAVKFTDAGYVMLGVHARGDKLVIRVADTGLGIEAARRASVFQRFYQVDEGLERRFSGTGLGLAITHDLVTLMQGKITLGENTPQGSVFEVSLPGALAPRIPVPAARVSLSEPNLRI